MWAAEDITLIKWTLSSFSLPTSITCVYTSRFIFNSCVYVSTVLKRYFQTRFMFDVFLNNRQENICAGSAITPPFKEHTRDEQGAI